MKKSLSVPATLVITFAAALTNSGCQERRECVDSQGRVVPSSYCTQRRTGYYFRTRTGGFGTSSSSSFGS